jgi:hypothetical protein
VTALLLKRASASRPSGEWNDDDYDVLADGAVVVGRIMKANDAILSGATNRGGAHTFKSYMKRMASHEAAHQ